MWALRPSLAFVTFVVKYCSSGEVFRRTLTPHVWFPIERPSQN